MALSPMDCFDWHPMEHTPSPNDQIFVRKGRHVGQGKWCKGKLTVAPTVSIQCWPDAWAPIEDELDLNA
jgi:hypothetical protein